ncbi:hypothetical protein RA280_27120 [Cupriavidus sp. CV2]|uniref:hypothetical protein n=1 Tax=Cupriavidus ulmosensis TaxID=3065913 RepID=UPI00296B5213|nr:hypothetical protein [Cupriavidus sp. CV2]MDW3685346.1 hypothetical protein [Cupriavidus sp. CV2]
METQNSPAARRMPWNKGKLTGQKPLLKLKEVRAIRTRLHIAAWQGYEAARVGEYLSGTADEAEVVAQELQVSRTASTRCLRSSLASIA